MRTFNYRGPRVFIEY